MNDLSQALQSLLRDVIASTSDISGFSDLADAWDWLVPNPSTAFLITALGDVFLKLPDGSVLFLNTDEGTVEPAGPSRREWENLVHQPERRNAWFAPQFVDALRSRHGPLGQDMVYSPIRPSVLGGEVKPENYDVRRWDAHVWVQGQIHKQVKDLPPGTPVTLKFDGW